MDLILNGRAHGNVAQQLLTSNFDVGSLRPYIGRDGRNYVTQNVNGKPMAVPIVGNTVASLRSDEWKTLDEVVIKCAKERLRLVADLRGSGLTFNLANGLSKTVLETETMSDISPATISMDPIRKGEADRPQFELGNLPLPVIHKDFFYTARQIAVSRNGGTPLDTTTAELAARRVAEEAEKLAIGTAGSFSYGGGSIYGITNFPSRITKDDVVAPTTSGWTPAQTVRDVLAMRQLSENAKHYGPWVLYNSPAWDEYLDDDYSSSKGDNTLRQRLSAIEGIRGVRTLDHMTGFQLVLVQQTTDVIREVVGMDITTLQWESEGGMRLNFKVMAILVPQLRADYNGNTGIVHGS
jgi:Family of unknown function (DUF6260)